MSIFLTILKVIALVVGALLAVLLAILLLVVFFPFCYGASGNLKPGENQFQGKVSWLFSLVQVRFEATGKNVRIWMSLFGWKKYLYPEPDVPPAKPKKKKKRASQKKKGRAPREMPQNLAGEPRMADIPKEPTGPPIEMPQKPAGEPRRGDTQKEPTGAPPKTKAKSLKKGNPWDTMKEKIGQIRQKIAAIREKIGNAKRTVTDEGNKRAVMHAFRELAALIRHYGPRRAKADLSYCAKDPALTGWVTGAMALVPACYHKGVDITPDFLSDTFFVRGTFEIHGHIQIFFVLAGAWRLYWDKDVKQLIKQFK